MLDRVLALLLQLGLLLVLLAVVLVFVMAPGIGGGAGAGSNVLNAGLFLGAVIYIGLVLTGAVAWHRRGSARPRERLPSRQRALPPAPRGPRG
jgi:hypothetical protein